MPHRIVVISDNKATRERFKSEAQVVPLWSDLREAGGKCFVRLKCFDDSFRQIIAEPRWCWIDLDMVLVDDVTPIFQKQGAFVMSGVELPPQPVNGSFVIADHGVAPELFTNFKNNLGLWQNNVKGRGLRYGGSDQAMIGLVANDKITKVTRDDGLFCYRDDIAPRHLWAYESWKRRSLVDGLSHEPTGGAMPVGARMLQMNGPWSPWSERVQTLSPWILQHYK